MRNMIKFLFALKGNAKACLLTEPLWGIPFNLYAPFITLYMYHLGVMDIEIGLILSIGRILQIGSSMAAGIITDKYGRRWVTFIGDVVSWSIPALIWAFSQNFWWFLVGAIVNAMWHITSVSWECLWVDDTEEEKIGPIFSWIYIAGLLAVFFAPIAGWFVHVHGVVPVVRVLYLFTFISMTAKFIILFIYSKETDRGLERMEATKNVSFLEMFMGYGAVMKQIIKSKLMMRAMFLQSILGVVLLITSTFFALYATQNLGVPEAFLAYFPILRAAIMLVFLLVIQEKLSKFKTRHMMSFGLVIYLLAMLWLLAAPQYNVAWLSIYIIMDAVAAALLLPRLDALAATAIDPTERARIRSLFNMCIMAFSAPFAYIAGILSDMDRRLPFMLNAVLFLVMLVIVILGGRGRKNEV